MKAILYQKIYYSKHIKKNLPLIFVTFPVTDKVKEMIIPVTANKIGTKFCLVG